MMINHLMGLLLILFAFEVRFLIFYLGLYLILLMRIFYLLFLLFELYFLLFLLYYFLVMMIFLLYCFYLSLLMLNGKFLNYDNHHMKYLLILNLLYFLNMLVYYMLNIHFEKVDHIHYFPNHKFFYFLLL